VLRRTILTSMGLAAVATGISEREAAAQDKTLQAGRGMKSPIIKDVSVIAVQPGGVRLVVVKVVTDQPGLYGYGCATFTQRAELVVEAVEKYLKPFVIGHPTDRIDDLWQAMYNASYWRSGPVLNNAISGVDQALWDIKGRQAGLPVYQLLGGKCREAAELYTHVNGADNARLIEGVRAAQAEGYRNFSLGLGQGGNEPASGKVLTTAPVFDREAYLRDLLKMLEAVRSTLGDEIDITTDVHERITPTQAIRLCKDLEQFRMFFVEDPLSPEDIDYFRILRQQSTTPIAMGELFVNPHESTPLIDERLIDYIRCHVSEVGGLTPARKIAILAEMHGVRTAWHGPGDVSPVGHCANLTLAVSAYNFGIQEMAAFPEASHEIFHGIPLVKNGYGYPNEAPGWGVEVDGKAAAKYPFRNDNTERGKLNGGWGELRLPDGTLIHP